MSQRFSDHIPVLVGVAAFRKFLATEPTAGQFIGVSRHQLWSRLARSLSCAPVGASQVLYEPNYCMRLSSKKKKEKASQTRCCTTQERMCCTALKVQPLVVLHSQL